MGENEATFKEYVAIVGAVTFWGLSFVWTNKLIHLGIPVFTFIFTRLFLAGIILLILNLCMRRIEKIRKEDIKWFILLAVCEPFLYFIGETYGIKVTNSPALSSLIIATIPIFTMIGDRVFYKTHIGHATVFGVLLTLPGVVLMIAKGGSLTSEYWWGILLLVMAVLSACGYNLCVRNIVHHYAPMTICCWQFLLGALMFAPLHFKMKGDFDTSVLFSGEALGSILCLTLLCSCLAFCLQLIAVGKLGITRTSVFNATIPIVSAIASFLYGMETFTAFQIAGILIVVLGVTLAQVRK